MNQIEIRAKIDEKEAFQKQPLVAKAKAGRQLWNNFLLYAASIDLPVVRGAYSFAPKFLQRHRIAEDKVYNNTKCVLIFMDHDSERRVVMDRVPPPSKKIAGRLLEGTKDLLEGETRPAIDEESVTGKLVEEAWFKCFQTGKSSEEEEHALEVLRLPKLTAEEFEQKRKKNKKRAKNALTTLIDVAAGNYLNAPKLPAQVPELPAQVPELPAQVPELPAQVPELPAQVPELPAQGPEKSHAYLEVVRNATTIEPRRSRRAARKRTYDDYVML